MSALNILDLKDDCLGYVLSYLSPEDQISFARVCHRFHEVFIAWSIKLHREFIFKVTKTKQELIGFSICRETVETLTIDLDFFDTGRIFRYYGCIAPLKCFGTLCFVLRNMVNLKRLIVKQVLDLATPIEQPFEQIFTAVKDLEELKVLELHVKDDYTFDNLSQLSRLEELHLLVKQISGPVLAKCCKSNPNIRYLHIGYNSVQHNLNDFLPHCGNLEKLKLGMLAEAADFLPIAKLSKLRQLSYFGVRPINSFVPLLTKLAARSELKRLEIDGGTLSPEETQQIVRLHGLQQLKCFCSSADCVEKLAQLKELQELSIWMSSRSDISAALLKVIDECKQLQLLCIASGNLKPDFVDNACKLLLEIRTNTTKEPLKLELPISENTKPIEKLCLQNKVLHYSDFVVDSWKR